MTTSSPLKTIEKNWETSVKYRLPATCLPHVCGMGKDEVSFCCRTDSVASWECRWFRNSVQAVKMSRNFWGLNVIFAFPCCEATQEPQDEQFDENSDGCILLWKIHVCKDDSDVTRMKVCLRFRKGHISRVRPVLSEITVKTSLLMINNKLLKNVSSPRISSTQNDRLNLGRIGLRQRFS